MDNFKVILEAVIDNSSLTDAQKKIAKEHFAASLDVELDVDSFAKQKKALSQNIDEMSKHFKKAFDKLQFKVDDKQLLSFTQEFFSEINKVAKAQEKLNELAKKQEQTEFLSKQTSFYRDIIKNQEDIYSLKKRLLSADELETEEIKKQIEALESRNKANRDSLSNNNMVDSSWDKIVQESKEALENQYRLTESRKVDGIIAKEIAAEEKERAKALEFTRKESEKLASAIQKYSYGDSSSANDMMKRLNRGVGNFSDLSSVDKEITTISSNVDKIIDGLKRSHEQSLKALNSAISAEEKVTKQIQPSIDNGAYSTQIDKLVSQFQKYGLSVDEAEEKVKELHTTLLSMKTAPSNESLVSDFEKWKQQIKDVNVQLEQAKLNYDKIAQEKLKEIDLSITNKSYEAEIAKLTNGFRNLSGDINEAKTHTESLNKAYRAMADATDDNTRLEAEKQYQLELSKTKNLLTIAQAEAREYVDALKVSKLRNDIQDWLKKNTAATKEAKDAMKTYLEMLDDVDGVSQATFNTVKGGMDDWDTKMRQAGKLGKSFTETFKEGAKSFMEWTLASVSVMEVIQGFKKMGQAVYEIDTAMTNLYKVTDETSQRYDKFLDSATGKAQELGRTVSSLVEQTANWSKLGFSLDEAENLAQISSIYANVGEVDDATAVSDMVTAMKAFNIEASDAITIVDMLNTLGNKYATSAADLGAGLSRSASAMATAGTDIEKTLAMLTGGAEITQSAEEFGNMLKIGSMRVRGMKGELEALGEEVDENVESISKMQTQVLNLTHGKVNIFNDNGEFKDYYDIMEGVAKIYSDLSSTEQASLSEILFGKQRGNQGAALIQAFQSGQIQKAYTDIQDSAGSAYEEQARWMESLEAKTAQFEAAFQSLSNTILDSDLLKWFVDFGTGSVNALDWVIDKLGTLGTIGLLGGAGLGIKNVGTVQLY